MLLYDSAEDCSPFGSPSVLASLSLLLDELYQIEFSPPSVASTKCLALCLAGLSDHAPLCLFAGEASQLACNLCFTQACQCYQPLSTFVAAG